MKMKEKDDNNGGIIIKITKTVGVRVSSSNSDVQAWISRSELKIEKIWRLRSTRPACGHAFIDRHHGIQKILELRKAHEKLGI